MGKVAVQLSGRMVAAVATSCMVQYSPEHLILYRDALFSPLGMALSVALSCGIDMDKIS